MFCCIRILSKKLSLQIRVTLRALLQWFRFTCDSVHLDLISETLNNTLQISLWTLRISSLLLLLLADGKFQSFASKRAVKAALKRWCQTRFSLFPKSDTHNREKFFFVSSSSCVFFFREKSSSILRLVGGLCERRRSASSDVKEGERRGPRETRTK